ncbi:MAG TPA: hypothetical protein VG940_02560 [Gemmatimonadales bacterium]|nr:hypothetical protein [Gemmatimonadales bacterium]
MNVPGVGRWVRRVAVVLLFTAPAPQCLTAQRIGREFGVQGYALLGDADQAGGGLFVARRAGPRGRISFFAGAGGGGQRVTGRGEALVHLLVAPGRRRGAAPYLAGGLGLDVATRSEARLVAVVGLEGSPGARQGWVIEAGVGGGWRLSAGWRWRR